MLINQSLSPDTANCIVSTTVSILEGQIVTQEALNAAVSSAAAQCGAAAASGNEIVNGIIDNYPTGGVPVSTTIVGGGGGQSPIDNFPTGG